MIGKARTGTSFGGLQGYLLHGHAAVAESEPGLQDYLLDGKAGSDRVSWATTRNLFPVEPQYASLVMSATAADNPRVQKPVYHLSLSASPGEELSRQQWENVVDRVLGELGLREHQALIVAHNDTRHPHVHVMVNRVHPGHLKAWSTSHDFFRIERLLRHLERDLKLREVPGRHFQIAGKEPLERNGQHLPERLQTARSGDETWADRIRFKIYEDLRRAESWGDLERRLAGHRLRLARRGGGLVITDGEHRVKASRVYRRASYRWLEQRFGMSFEEWRSGRRELLDAVARYQEIERRRVHLDRLRDRAWSSYIRQRDAVAKRDRIRGACRSAASEIDRHLRSLFRDEDLPRVRRRLVSEARRHGWLEAATRLEANPRRYGRYRPDPRHPQVRSTGQRRHRSRRRLLWRRHYRSRLLQQIKSTAFNLTVLRGARLVAGPAGFRAASLSLSAYRTWQRTVRRRDLLPSPQDLLKEIAGRAAVLGIRRIALAVAPQPLKVIDMALRAAKLARALVHDLSRGR